jgi:hypothetical protein
MKPSIKLKVTGPGVQGVQTSMRSLTHKSILVGVPATDAAQRVRQIMALAQG